MRTFWLEISVGVQEGDKVFPTERRRVKESSYERINEPVIIGRSAVMCNPKRSKESPTEAFREDVNRKMGRGGIKDATQRRMQHLFVPLVLGHLMEHVGIEVETIVAENMEQERPPAAMLLLFAQLHGVFQHLSSLRPAQLREQDGGGWGDGGERVATLAVVPARVLAQVALTGS